ncbi:MAG TPA: class I SAM-dependent methyltransferase [Thermomicrobiales bacterium]|nr:class I SAM-dependent methyltransferase [Thermomicrobiales bacterium]
MTPLPDWYLDELAHAGPEHLDTTYVPRYDQKAATDPEEDLALLQRHGLGPADTLVDLGAGTGTFAVAAAALCRRVVAVDVSRPMLAVLEEKLGRDDIANVEVVRAGFLSYQHQGAPADVVYSRHALHHLPDFWKVVALDRITRMLRPGGIFFLRDLVYTIEPDEVGDVIEAWLGRATADPAAGWTRAELATHVREEFSPFSWLLEPMLERAGFRIEEAQSHGSTYATYVCARR